VDDFKSDLALVEAVDAGHEPFNVHDAIDAVNDLLPKGVLLMVVDGEVRAESVPNEGV
jgi:hypothetical protein